MCWRNERCGRIPLSVGEADRRSLSLLSRLPGASDLAKEMLSGPAIRQILSEGSQPQASRRRRMRLWRTACTLKAAHPEGCGYNFKTMRLARFCISKD
jgi:hypothetical protein